MSFFCPSERLSIARDEAGSAHLAQLDETILSLQRQAQELRSQWELERVGIVKLQELRNSIDSTLTAIAKAEREYDLSTAATLKFGTLPDLQRQLKAEEELHASGTNSKSMIYDTVTENDIAGIVSSWTGVPVSKLLQTEMQKLLRLQDRLDESVVGQRAATKVVAEAIQRSRAGMSDPSKPIATLAFLGPTGVGTRAYNCSPLPTSIAQYLFLCSDFVFEQSGKTELCKALARYLFDSDDAMVSYSYFDSLIDWIVVLGCTVSYFICFFRFALTCLSIWTSTRSLAWWALPRVMSASKTADS